MVIKSSKSYCVFGFVLMLVALVSVTMICIEEPVILYVFLIPGYFFSIRWFVSTYSFYELNKEGCTVKFMHYQKTYKWDDLKTKAVVPLPWGSASKMPYDECVILSPKKYKYIRRIIRPYEYRVIVHPLQFMVIHFDIKKTYSKKEQKDRTNGPDIHVVNKEDFLEKLQEWNVKLEIYDKN